MDPHQMTTGDESDWEIDDSLLEVFYSSKTVPKLNKSHETTIPPDPTPVTYRRISAEDIRRTLGVSPNQTYTRVAIKTLTQWIRSICGNLHVLL